MKAVAILFLMLSIMPAWARLGETEDQLTQRYGSPIQVATNASLRTLNFNFGEYLVQARLRDGKSVIEFAYLKKKGVEFKEGDALAVASRIAGATNWAVMDSEAFRKSWAIKNSDQSGFIAQLNTPPGGPQSIMVSTAAEILRSDKSDPSKDASKGF